MYPAFFFFHSFLIVLLVPRMNMYLAFFFFHSLLIVLLVWRTRQFRCLSPSPENWEFWGNQLGIRKKKKTEDARLIARSIGASVFVFVGFCLIKGKQHQQHIALCLIEFLKQKKLINHFFFYPFYLLCNHWMNFQGMSLFDSIFHYIYTFIHTYLHTHTYHAIPCTSQSMPSSCNKQITNTVPWITMVSWRLDKNDLQSVVRTS